MVFLIMAVSVGGFKFFSWGKRESLEINNLETKVEYDKSIKVLNGDWGNIVNMNS